MSVLAGVVALHEGGVASTSDVRAMLRSMQVLPDSRSDIHVDPSGRIAVGRLHYGPDVAAQVVIPGQAAVLMSGELYDLPAGTANAAEYLLGRYRDKGLDRCSEGLNGSFAAVILDFAAGSLAVLNDHVSSCPIFIRQADGVLYFASEVKALVAPAHLPCRIDTGALLSLLTCDQLLNWQTWVEDVRQLPPATVLTFAGGKLSRRQWWTFAIDDDARDAGAAAFARDMERLMAQAVARRTRETGRVAMTVTGGVDSRTILSFLENRSSIKAVTFVQQDLDRLHSYGDGRIGQKMAALAQMEHLFLTYDPACMLEDIDYTVGQSDGAVGFVREHVYDSLRQRCHCDFLLLGDENSGVAGGPVRHDRLLDYLGIRALAGIPSLWPVLNADRLREFLQISEAAEAELGVDPRRPAHNVLDELCFTWRNSTRMAALRWMINRHLLRPRQPLLDLELLQFVQGLPRKYRVAKSLVRGIVQSRSPELYRLPRARGRDAADYAAVLRRLEGQGQVVSHWLFDDNPLLGEFLDRPAVERLLQLVTREPTAAAPRRRFGFRNLLPVRSRMWLTAMARYTLGMTSPMLSSPLDVLLRVMEVSRTIKHVSRRCPSPLSAGTERVKG